MNEVTVQRNYKDTIFRMLFKDKQNLLSLYNALNKTDYTDVEQVRKYAKQVPLADAVEKAVDECIAEGTLSDFLRENRAEGTHHENHNRRRSGRPHR